MKELKEYFIMMWKFFNYALSFKGSCSRMLYYCFLSLGYFTATTTKLFETPFTEALGLFIYFYIVLASLQKRCRDFGYRGTLPIFIVSIYFIYWITAVSAGKNYKILFGDISLYIRLLFYFTITSIGFIPETKDKNLTLTSLLLKYPNIYFTVCIGLFFISRYILQHF